MTEIERSELARAIERAHRNDVRVVCEGQRRDTGEVIYLVSSSTNADQLHIVYLAEPGHLGCSCAAYHWHPETPCTHRAVVHERLLEQHAARCAPTASNRDAAAATAPLRRSNQPFSMMK